uniref:Tubulin-specific chaperone C N-terminal domain-containing protein n=1 Tax=Romanomermis culicivorax TaxID=13658 RepID=A0A915I8U4_ROMCU
MNKSLENFAIKSCVYYDEVPGFYRQKLELMYNSIWAALRKMADKKAQILARLNKRNVDRSAHLKSKSLTPSQVFESNFNQLSADLQQVCSNFTLKNGQSDNNMKVEINRKLNDLRQILAESASILSKYEKTRYQKLLKDLELKSNDAVTDDNNRVDLKNVPTITQTLDAVGEDSDVCDSASCDPGAICYVLITSTVELSKKLENHHYKS